MSIYLEFQKEAKKNLANFALAFEKNNQRQKISYAELLDKIDFLAENLAKIGIKQNTKVAIMGENCPEWVMSDLAINKLGAVSVPIHAIASEDFIKHVLADSGADFLILSQALLEKHKDFLNNLKLKIILFQDLLIENKKAEEAIKAESAPNNLASIVYTSGTTGKPKGVMLTNENFLANIRAASQAVPVYSSDVFLSFLPLSHVLERTVGNYIPLFSGALIYYNQDIKKLADDLKAIKPTIIVSVPKIFERIYEKIWAQAQANPKALKQLFFWALKQRENNFKRFFADKLVFKKVRRAFGGKLRFAVSGGASISPQILKFFQNAGIVITEGYGLTETSPIISANRLDNIKIGTVGQPLEGVEVKIANDKEILARGKNVMLGYHNRPEETKEALSQDGWFATGDLGFLDSDKFLTIIGRKKDLIITSNGKNIAPEKIENILNLSPYILQSLVVGHKRNYLAALIVFQGENKTEAEQKELISQELKKINKQLDAQEQIREFKILSRPFSLEAGELTPTLKLRRKIIEAEYSKIIEGLYKI